MSKCMLSESEKDRLRSLAGSKLEELKNEAATTTTSPLRSWIAGRDNPLCVAVDDKTHSDLNRFFNLAGFAFLPSFCDACECQAMKDKMQQLVETEWNPEQGLDSFGTRDQDNTARGDYFLESSDKIHFFAEADTIMTVDDDEGNNNTKQQVLKPEFMSNKIEALNKVGHALHMQPGSVFHKYCLSDNIKRLVVDELKWTDPVVPQSMYIFKQAIRGGAVNSHQDSTFLFTEPKQSCLGLWLALDEATLDNGCLWVRPKSHDNEPVRRQYKRNPQHFGQEAIDNQSNVPKGNTDEPKFVMHDLYEYREKVPWEGDLPGNEENVVDELLKAGFIPVECKAGDLLVFNGELDHLSLPNHSDKARHTFQLHLVEGPKAGVSWSKSNWLQYPPDKPFLSLLHR